MLFDFVNSKDLSDELKIKEIYNLFKTNSLEFNKQFLLNLKEYPTFAKLIIHFTKIDISTIPFIFNDIESVLSKITKDEKISDFNSDIESFISGLLKIVLSFYIIEQNNQLLINIINKTKNYIQYFFSNTKNNCFIKEKLDKYINNLISLYQPTPNRYNSRRSTKDSAYNNLLNDKMHFFYLRKDTPHFEEVENFEKINISFKDSIENEGLKKTSAKIDSSLTLQKINFVQIEEDREMVNVNKNPIKKFNSERLKKKNKSSSCDSNSSKKRKHKKKHTSIKKKESLFNRKRNTSSNIEYGNNNNSTNNNEKIKILTEFFDSIKILYRYGKITSEQKINIKQLLISKPMIIIEKFFKRYNDININCDKTLLIEKIENFLMDEINCLY